MQQVYRYIVTRLRLHVISAVILPTIAFHAVSEAASPLRDTLRTPGCEGMDAKNCLGRAFEAMGGRERLASIETVRLDLIGHTSLMEQSYRQAPFITSYDRDQITRDFAHQSILDKKHTVWPESDPMSAESDLTLVATPQGCVYRSGHGDLPCAGADLDAAYQSLTLGPERLLLSAAGAPDLHFLAPEFVRSTKHTVLAFTWNNIPVRILLNPFNYLPDAVETTQQFRDFWFFWGDVNQRVYFDNWKLVHGVEYPTNQVTQRNGNIWSSVQALDVEFDKEIDDKSFTIDVKAAHLSTQSKGWNHDFQVDRITQLAPGIDLFRGPWNATIVKQSDGLIILETPISTTYTSGLFAEAHRRYPGVPIKAVLSTSDSWPHVGGVRFDVAEATPVYILELNQPLLGRMIAAPHTLDPDALQIRKRAPLWRIVSATTEVGDGPNRMLLYPLRGASTERQYMVYFPEHHLLYASDTLVLNPDHTLYDPELMHEVQQVVEREHLAVEVVYAMHEGPTPWKDVVALIHKAML
jgi:hypothetical protein